MNSVRENFLTALIERWDDQNKQMTIDIQIGGISEQELYRIDSALGIAIDSPRILAS